MPLRTISWTYTDEAPALASHSLLPVVRAFTKDLGVKVNYRDISLAGRILATFPDFLTEEQRISDDLAELGELAKKREAAIFKLPNNSASVGQLLDAISELQAPGFNVPAYPETPMTEIDNDVKARYAKVLGAAVNPVLREGNSDRRAADSVKQFAMSNPHRMMKPWPESGSKTRVAHMTETEFFGSEKSVVLPEATEASIVFVGNDGNVLELISGI